MTERRSVCPYCGVGCGLLVDVRRGRIDGVRGDPDHPANRGGLCGKGARLAETARTGDRLLHPMWRSRADRPLRRVGWQAAVARVAGGIRRAVTEHGPGAVALYLSGQLLTEDYYAANKLGKGLIGTANVDTNSRLCMASTVVAYRRAFGADGPPGCYEDLDLARDVLVVGSNLAETHPVLFGRLRAAGPHMTVVDPRRTATAEAADDHLALRPGTDVALLLAAGSVLFEEGLVDEDAVRRSCAGLDDVRAAAAAMPPERAAGICEIEAGRIRALARRFARSPAALSLWCQGLNQATSGTDRVGALINLHLLTGQLGRPGAGPFSLTGQSNAMGGREVGGLATELACRRGWDDAAGRAEVERHWGLGPLPTERGLTAVELIDAIAGAQVRVLWVVCSNPAASLPDGRAVRDALRQLDLLVVQDVVHPTDTGELAHVLLPAAAWGEKTGTMTSSERRVALAHQLVPAPGEARPDWAIFAAVGAALGAPHAFAWRDAAAVFDEHVRLTAGRDLDMTALSHALLQRDGPQHWPYPAGGRPRARRYEDGCFHTPDGRARLVHVAFREPAEPPTADRPLRLVTGRDRDRWHTEARTGRVAALRAGPEPVLEVHPSDAALVGVREGGVARVESARGGVFVRVAVSPGLRPGTVFLPFHVGPLARPDGWVNALMARALDPLSFQPELKHAAVRVVPAGPVALAGGTLAAAVVRALREGGVEAMLVSLDELGRTPDHVLRALVAEADLAVEPWWEVAVSPPPAPAGGRATLDLAAGPEPLAAVPALADAGWEVGWRRERWLPEPVRRIVRRRLAAGHAAGTLVVGGPRASPRPEAPADVLVLVPGGRLGQHAPLSADPATLAAYLGGVREPRRALRRLVAALGPRVSLLVAGEPLGHPERDREQGVDLLVHEDRVGGTAQVWRITDGQVLGVAAVLAPPAVEDAEALWLADPEPALLRRRFPVH